MSTRLHVSDSLYLFCIFQHIKGYLLDVRGYTVYCTFLCVPNVALSHSQLLVGSEDFDIRVFREDELVSEMTENEVT